MIGFELLLTNPFAQGRALDRQRLTEDGALPALGASVDEWAAWHREAHQEAAAIGDDFPDMLGVGTAACMGVQEPFEADADQRLAKLFRIEKISSKHMELGARAGAVARALNATAGSSVAMQGIRRRAWAAAFGQNLRDVDVRQSMIRRTPVLIQGESGTGKELIAAAISLAQPGAWDRKKAAWTPCKYEPMHLGSIPRALVADALFGHDKGAFSDAKTRRAGVLERCHEGTVFLDEIAELPNATQVALLRCLQEGKVRRLGSETLSNADPRVISATHVDLDQAVQDKRFRGDLLQRLRSVEIVIPPLRDRLDDLPDLVERLLISEIGAEARGELKQRVMQFLEEDAANYAWPGNVRELAAAIRGIGLGIPPRLRRSAVAPLKHQEDSPPLPADNERPLGFDEFRAPMRAVQRWYARAVANTSTSQRAACERLGITTNTLRKLLGEALND